MSGPERREATADLSGNGLHVRAGFRLTSAGPLARGPVEIAFFVENLSEDPLFVALAGDRMSGRPAGVAFSARCDGTPLRDPAAAVPDFGGPVGTVVVAARSSLEQELVLNEFVRLEDVPAAQPGGGTARLEVACRRPFPLATTERAALISSAAPLIAVDLAFDLRDDPPALAALLTELLDRVLHGPAAERERPLRLLLSLRSAARAQLESLARQPDPVVAGRARHALAASTR
ncbi:MAG TPA: hypothetical protein VGD01_09765 [Candidatus Elarobacter sp.]